jgi:beta-lactamase regulating signal transducer with metallopeptidase domain/HEAT repeat protein
MTVQILGWTLLHSLWQGALIAAALAAFFFLTAGRSPSLRYWAGLVGLLAMVALPLATAFQTAPDDAGYATLSPEAPTTLPAVPSSDVTPTLASETSAKSSPANATVGSTVTSLISRTEPIVERIMPWLVTAWLLGLLLSSVRLFGGLARTRQLTRRGVSKASRVIDERIRALAHRINVRRAVRVLESTRTTVPLVVGVIRPAIVLPASLLTGLTPLQLDMLLTHELMHIRRNDFAVNLVQTVIETLLFYHPAAHWISARVREERESCCDDVAIATSGGDARVYAETLLALEETRTPDYGLAAAATGGSLLKRVRRIVLGEPTHVELGPRWIAGVVTIAAAMFAGSEAVALDVRASLVPTFEVAASTDTTRKDRRPDPSRGAPSTVVRAPSGGSLEDRWQWAQQRGSTLGSTYWIGYLVAGDKSGRSQYYASETPVWISNGSITMTGSMFFVDDNLSELNFSGVKLAPIVGAHSPRSTVILFLMRNGKQIERMHIASFGIPAYFDRKPLGWLDSAGDAESLRRLHAMMPDVDADARRNLVGAIGVHGSHDLVIPALATILRSSGDEGMRSKAAEWIGRKSGREVVSLLSRAARSDRAQKVRLEAIEAFSHMQDAAATDTLIALASTAGSERERRRAIEAIGHRNDRRAVSYLERVADSGTGKMAEEATEALSSLPDGAGLAIVEKIAKTGRQVGARRAAVEAIGSSDETKRAITTLTNIARTDADESVRIAAVEALASVHDAASVVALRSIARQAQVDPVQMAAIEALGETGYDMAALTELRSIAETHPVDDARMQALKTLGELNPDGAMYLMSVVRGSERDEIRIRALEAYADHASGATAVNFLKSIATGDRSGEVRIRAVEVSEDLPREDTVPLLRELARSAPDPAVRQRALEILNDN